MGNEEMDDLEARILEVAKARGLENAIGLAKAVALAVAGLPSHPDTGTTVTLVRLAIDEALASTAEGQQPSVATISQAILSSFRRLN